MTIQNHSVTVEKLPKLSNGKRARVWLNEMQNSMDADHPRMVLDCSDVPWLDRTVVDTLLCCLEEAMKRNGDVKLAALPPESQAILERAGAGPLFEVYRTLAEAVNSFDLPSIRAISLGKAPVSGAVNAGSTT